MTAEPTMATGKLNLKKKPKKAKKDNASGAKSLWIVAIILALIASGSVLAIITQVTARTTYWVMNQDVAARTPITPAMLTEIETSKNGAPKVGLTPAMVARGNLYSKIALQTGDVPSTTTVGPLERINANIPGNMVVASFSLDAESAVGGKIRAGDLIDLISQNGDEPSSISKVVLYRVKVIDVTIAPKAIADAATSGQEGNVTDKGPDSAVIKKGIPSLYTVAVTPTDATKINALRGTKMSAVLSAATPQKNLDASTTLGSVFAKGGVGDSSAGIRQTTPTTNPTTGTTNPTTPNTNPTTPNTNPTTPTTTNPTDVVTGPPTVQ